MKHFILSALIFATAATMYGRVLTPEQALSRAEESMPSTLIRPMSADGIAIASLVHTEKEAGSPTVYVFNRTNGSGYLVVSADDESGPALLGYSDEGSFDGNSLPENLSWWLRQYSREIASVNSVRTQSGLTPRGEDFDIPYFDPVDPICETKWNQTTPYNNLTPVIDGKHCPTGCVATAMAQAMKVFNWPEHGVGSHTYRPSSIDEYLTVNFADSTYHWDKMLDTYTASSPQENIDAVASLMYSCGVAISMQYHPNSAGGNYMNAAKAFVNNFNYDKSLRIIARDYYGIIEWFTMIYNEISEGRPVLYSGRNDEGGHAFVCDGYSHDGYFHINWGWGGLSNSYFLLTALEPEDQGVGGSSAGYNVDQQILIGLRKPVDGSTVVPVMQFTSNFIAPTPSVARTAGSVKLGDRRGIFNESLFDMTATLGVKLQDENGNVSYIESTTPDKKYIPGQGFLYYYVPTANFPTEGTYTVSPAVKDEAGQWFDCEVKIANQRELTLVATADSLLFTPTSVPAASATDLQLLSPIYPGKECGIRAVVTNNGEEEFYEKVTPILVQDHADMGSADPIEIELLPGESFEFEWVGNFPSTIVPGDYLLYLVDSNNKDLNSAGLPVTVEEAPTAATQVVVTSTDPSGAESTEAAPYKVDYSQFRADVHVKCDSGYFSGMVYGGVFPLTGTVGIKEIPGGYLAVREGEEGVMPLEDDLSTWLHENQVYYFLAITGPNGRVGNKLYFTYSPTSGVDPIGADDGALRAVVDSGRGVVEIDAPEEISAVRLYDAQGRLVAAYRNINGKQATIDAGGLTDGIYLISVEIPGGCRVVKVKL